MHRPRAPRPARRALRPPSRIRPAARVSRRVPCSPAHHPRPAWIITMAMATRRVLAPDEADAEPRATSTSLPHRDRAHPPRRHLGRFSQGPLGEDLGLLQPPDPKNVPSHKREWPMVGLKRHLHAPALHHPVRRRVVHSVPLPRCHLQHHERVGSRRTGSTVAARVRGAGLRRDLFVTIATIS